MPEKNRSPRALLSVKNLRVGIPVSGGTVHAVDGVSLDLERGKILGIVGESGSGKSVLCKTILGLHPRTATIPEISAIRFDGQDLLHLTEKQMNRIRGKRISMVLQDPMSSLNPTMKTGIQIAESLVYHLKTKRSEAMGKALDLLRWTGVPDAEQRLKQYPRQLSGGLRQRAAIAMALVCEPELLIADEPTTALDVTVQAEILDMLERLRQEKNMAVILVTHDLAVAASSADEIAVMYGGKIVERSAAQDLFSKMRMPYTKALVESIPRPEAPPHTRLESIEGEASDALRPSSGCPFEPRCRYVIERCANASPPLISANGDRHLFACWNPLSAGKQRRNAGEGK